MYFLFGYLIVSQVNCYKLNLLSFFLPISMPTIMHICVFAVVLLGEIFFVATFFRQSLLLIYSHTTVTIAIKSVCNAHELEFGTNKQKLFGQL